MAKIKSTHPSQESQTERALRQVLALADPEREKLLFSLIFDEPGQSVPKPHIGHLLEFETFGICPEFPKLSQSEIEKRVLVDPTEAKLYQMFGKVVRENFADVL